MVTVRQKQVPEDRTGRHFTEATPDPVDPRTHDHSPLAERDRIIDGWADVRDHKSRWSTALRRWACPPGTRCGRDSTTERPGCSPSTRPHRPSRTTSQRRTAAAFGKESARPERVLSVGSGDVGTVYGAEPAVGVCARNDSIATGPSSGCPKRQGKTRSIQLTSIRFWPVATRW
jgi:hypothetical protein